MSNFLDLQQTKDIMERGALDELSVWGLCCTHLGYQNTFKSRQFLYHFFVKDRRFVRTLEANNRLHCICRKKNDPKKAMVQCISCEVWFHFECVSYDNTPSKTYTDYVCPDCLNINGSQHIKPFEIPAVTKKTYQIPPKVITHISTQLIMGLQFISHL